MSKWIMHDGTNLVRHFICIYIYIFFCNGKCKCAILWWVCVWEPSCWINVTLGYPHAPQHINHRDTFTTLLIRQGPQCTPSNIPTHPSRTPSLSHGQSQGIGEGGGGGRARAWDGEGGFVYMKLDPFIQKPSLGTTAGTRLLLRLSTVAPHEQQKTPPNTACSSPLNTHRETRKHT